MGKNAKFGLEILPDRPYIPTGFQGNDRFKNTNSSSFIKNSDQNRRSKSPGRMSPALAALDKINV